MHVNILVTGGSGRLGRLLRKLTPCYAPSSQEFDITARPEHLTRYLQERYIDLVIHCAGFANSAAAEVQKETCWKLNAVGTENIAKAANNCGARFVYISTDYVFDGEAGNYTEDATPAPVNFYGVSKLAGEMVTRQYHGSLVIRAPFRADPPWVFARAFVDQWTSCDFASVRAPQILKAALMNDLNGVIHIGGPRRSIYELALTVRPTIGRMFRGDLRGLTLPKDTSLDSSRWQSREGAGRMRLESFLESGNLTL